MDIDTYSVESRIEQNHWWFVVRRNLFKREIARFRLGNDVSVLDVGTSTGTNLRLLNDMGFGNVLGLDMSPEAVRWCREKDLGEVRLGSVCDIPFRNDSYDLILATDILEHVDDDLLAIRELKRVLKPGGKLLITVPAFPSLWGLQDQVSQHKRRYVRGELEEKVAAAGLSVVRRYYFNFLLFPPIWLVRQILKLNSFNVKSENEINSAFVNFILKRIFSLDVLLARRVKPPFGVSLLLLAEKP